MEKTKTPEQKKELLKSAEVGLQKNKTFDISVYLEKAKLFFDTTKKTMITLYKFFRDNKNNSKIMLVFALLTTGIAIYFAVQLIADINNLKAKTPELVKLKTYDIHALQENKFTQTFVRTSDSIQDLLEEHGRMWWEIEKYTEYLSSLQIPYTYFLQYIYLPSLNVWKEKYTNQIDINLMGIRFLEKNPFNDITLLQRRGDFFKNLGDNNESNDILDMQIGDFVEDEKGFFTMPISVSFVANSKRAFLLLADKLSITSNKENISLINEFFYYLRSEVKKGKEKEIKKLEEEYVNVFGSGEENTSDKIIWYHLYSRIFNNQKNILIDNKILDKTIKSIISCNNEPDELCYYKFRERYRDIPSFGYLIGTDFGSDWAENLKKFILQLPPIFSIKEFEFDKIKSPTLSDASNNKYQGKVTIMVYGRSASVEEVEEIALALGNKCLWEDKALTTSDGLGLVQSAIVKLWEISTIDKSYGDNLRELKKLVEQSNDEYPELNNYKKTIKLFELYRMLSDAGLCK